MKTPIPVNQDFQDWDEIDVDALDAFDDYHEGVISFDELRSLVGTEAAYVAKAKNDEKNGEENLFDDPETF